MWILKPRDINSYSAESYSGYREGHDFELAYDCRVTGFNSIMSHNRRRWEFVFFGEDSNSHSLLTPGQFNAILYGGCEKNKLFNECSQLAYESSIEKSDCLAKKEQCERQNALGYSKEEEMQGVKETMDFLEYQKQVIAKDKRELFPLDMEEYHKARFEAISRALYFLEEKLQTAESWPDH